MHLTEAQKRQERELYIAAHVQLKEEGLIHSGETACRISQLISFRV